MLNNASEDVRTRKICFLLKFSANNKSKNQKKNKIVLAHTVSEAPKTSWKKEGNV